MNRALPLLVVAIGLLATAASPAADETYTIKLYKAKTGDKTEHQKTEDENTVVDVSFGGKDDKQTMKSSRKVAYTEVVLEKKDGDKRPTKLTRAYTADEKTEKGKTTKAGYVGQTVLIEKKGAKYAFSVDGKALTEADAPDLFKKFDRLDKEPENEDILPEKPVKVGDSWTVSADKNERLFKMFDGDQMKIDTKKSSAAGKLLKVYKKDGAQFGTLEFTLTVVVTDLDLGGKFAPTAAGSKMVLKATVDTCIDGTVGTEDSQLEATMDITVELPNKGSFKISGKSTGAEKVRPVKK
jgi:hypothetical protein